MADNRQDAVGSEADDNTSPKRFLVPGILLLALIVGGWWLATHLKGGSSEPKRQTVKIAVLPDTPPPPPPPPPPDKKIEPEVKEQKPQPQEDQPKPLDKPPEPEQLKMEGAAGDGPSAFGSGSVSKDYIAGDPGNGMGGGGKLQFALFNGQLQRHVQSSLARNPKAKIADYRVNVQVWVSAAGELRVELLSSTGDEKSDEVLRQALTQMPPISNVPANLVQPIRLRITNRMTG
jgi:protein TonB